MSFPIIFKNFANSEASRRNYTTNRQGKLDLHRRETC